MSDSEMITRLRAELTEWPDLQAAFLFGSVAQGRETHDSDLDLAVQMKTRVSAEQKMALIGHLAGVFGRPVDVVDLREVGQPLLGEIVGSGVLIKGSSRDRGDLLFKSIMAQEDFAPYQQRILEGRRNQWIKL